MEIVYKNFISVDDYLFLRKTVKWADLCKEQAQQGLDNSAYVIACYENNKIIGQARIIWDRGYIAYLSDVIVLPEKQGRGIGHHLVESVIAFVKSQLKPNWKIKIVLVASKGKETFYKQFGFSERPNSKDGCGMDLWIL